MAKKVSIITPCYNGENFVERFLDSILDQTYNNLELIFINDGSIDNTEKIFKSYENKFKKNNIDFKYIYQENAGQAAALNKGLKIFNGDYLTWPDSDDILTPESIEKKVKFLEQYTKYGIVRTEGLKVKENDINESIGYLSNKSKNRFKEDLFDDYIQENNVWFPGGCFLVRREVFLQVIPNKNIYVSRGGQNYQILLPILNKYKCGYIDEPLYKYLVRGNSHSRNVNTLKEKLKRVDEHRDILLNTIKTIDVDQNKYFAMIDLKYKKKNFYLAVNYNNKELAKKYYEMIKNDYKINYKDKIHYYASKNMISNVLFKITKKVIFKIKNVLS
jgi:glycosyltransferase involved in cell wall biosynthesis